MKPPNTKLLYHTSDIVRFSERMFEKMNLTPTGIKILLHLARSPGKEYYLREIAEILSISTGGCHNILGELNEKNRLKKRQSGKNTYFMINEDNPGIKHFKIFSNIQELQDQVRKIQDNTIKITLFGSCATGEDTIESDIDLFIITEESEKVRESMDKLIGERYVKPIIQAPHEVIQLKKNDKAFYDEVNKGIVLWRNKDERV